MFVLNDTLWYTQSNWHDRNEACGRYLLFYESLLQSCLHNFRLKLFSKLFCTNKATNVCVCVITCDRISTSSLIVLSTLFIQMFLFLPKHFQPYVNPDKPLHLRYYISSKSDLILLELMVNFFNIYNFLSLLTLLHSGSWDTVLC